MYTCNVLVVKALLSPFSLFYKIITSLRNWSYNKGILKSKGFSLPIISVGNLTVGGTGKTPHIEFLIKLLKSRYNVATLSRGYGRKTKGFIIAGEECSSEDIGDEPMQYFKKFADITVTVGENRVNAVEALLEKKPGTEVILLDDAFQHRAIKPGLSILLTEYNKLFRDNYLLPVGTLRESASGMKRADIIVVTKTPTILSPLEKRRVESEIRPLPYQKLFYSYIRYGELTPTWPVSQPLTISKEFYLERKYTILLVTGIADPGPLHVYLKEAGGKIEMMSFPDHHSYSSEDLEKIKKRYEEIRSQNKIIVTTEKDYMRFMKPSLIEALKELKIFYLPIEVCFHECNGKKIENEIFSFISDFQQHSQAVAQ